ncbi:MAG TPA: SBBP repeat-containing protein, partial [Bacteroidia bacterium]|nr:SBBP repeat-containing protein [Bacteroidia bacterium]
MKHLTTLVCALALTTLIQAQNTGSSPEEKPANISHAGFYENKGQIVDQDYNPNPAVKYLYTGNGLNVQLRANGFSYDTYTFERKPRQKKEGESQIEGRFKMPDEDITYHFHRIDVNLKGANPTPTIITAQASEAYYNYITAGTPKGGISNVHSYRQVTYQNIYPNIDLQFIGDEKKGIKYNFIVHPGGDYTQIKLQYKGVEGIKLQDGEILIPTSNGSVSENIPLSYLQENKQQVTVSYKTTNENEFTFVVNGNYNTSNTLVIDPVPNLVWGTYFGGTGNDFGDAIAIDATNNTYITGYTSSTSTIATAGAWQTTQAGNNDAFVAKFNPTGSSLLWATYYGGPGNDYGQGIKVDTSDNVYITGYTNSTSGMVTGGAYQTSNV